MVFAVVFSPNIKSHGSTGKLFRLFNTPCAIDV